MRSCPKASGSASPFEKAKILLIRKVIKMTLFDGYLPDENTLKAFGFTLSGNDYVYTQELDNDGFELVVRIHKDGTVSDSVLDLETNEPYTPYQTGAHGSFIDELREQARVILENIRSECFLPAVYASGQARQVLTYMKEKYNAAPEFLWDEFPSYAVFRHGSKGKWFGLMMDLPETKFDLDSDRQISVLNLYRPKDAVPIVNGKNIFGGWHMNKKTWISVLLDGSLDWQSITALIDESYQSTM